MFVLSHGLFCRKAAGPTRCGAKRRASLTFRHVPQPEKG